MKEEMNGELRNDKRKRKKGGKSDREPGRGKE
jgi:hypothetical protein